MQSSADTLCLTKLALRVLKAIYRSGFNYVKAGIMLLDLQSAQRGQLSLFSWDEGSAKLRSDGLSQSQTSRDIKVISLSSQQEPQARENLMAVVDNVNQRYGQGKVKPASIGVHEKAHWYMRQERKTQGYTTNWNELLIARA